MGNLFDFHRELIGNSRFHVTKHPGTGNFTTKQAGVKHAEMVRLQNWLIDDSVVSDVLQLLYDMGEDAISVKLSNRRCSQRWGTAWGFQRRVTIYRWTAWTFLHELAHVLVWDANIKVKAHGREFGKYLKMLYDLWMEHIEPRWDDVKKKAALDNPDIKTVNFNPDVFKDIRKRAQRRRRVTIPKRDGHVVQGGEVTAGDKVWFYGTRGRKVEGRVKRVNKKSCRITDCTINGEPCADWRVSPRLLHKYL